MSDSPPPWREVFDVVSASYDQSGVPFFRPIAHGLCARLAVQPGARVAELGCGRGALTLPLAMAVGRDGVVDAVDLSPRMVSLAVEATKGMSHVAVTVGDAADPPLPDGSYDVVAASLVLFFLPDPVTALRRWRDLVVAGGRAGISTFAVAPPSWAAMERIFEDELSSEEAGRDLRGGVRGPYASDAGVEGLFDQAGWRDARSETEVLDVPFRNADQWREWMHGTALRTLWLRLTPRGQEHVMTRMGQLLDDQGGRVQVAIRHTLAHAPSESSAG